MMFVINPIVGYIHKAGVGTELVDGTHDDVLDMAIENFGNAEESIDTPGVLLVPLNSERFLAGTKVYSEGDDLRAEFVARQPGEMLRLNNYIVAPERERAAHACAVLYPNSVLANGTGPNGEVKDERSDVNADYELITFLASPPGTEYEDCKRMAFLTKCYNVFGADGGTIPKGKTSYQVLAELEYCFQTTVKGIFTVRTGEK